MINVIECAFAAPQIDQILYRCDEVFVRQDTLGSIDINPELLINFVTTDPPKIVLLWIEEEPLEQCAGVGHSRRIARTKAAVNVFESFFLVVRRVFSKRLHDRVIVRNVDDFYLVDIQRHDLADRRQSQRLKRACDGHFAIANVCSEHFAGELLFIQLVAQFGGLNVVKEFDDVLVGAVAQSAQESGGQKFPASLASVEINVKEVSRIELYF